MREQQSFRQVDAEASEGGQGEQEMKRWFPSILLTAMALWTCGTSEDVDNIWPHLSTRPHYTIHGRDDATGTHNRG